MRPAPASASFCVYCGCATIFAIRLCGFERRWPSITSGEMKLRAQGTHVYAPPPAASSSKYAAREREPSPSAFSSSWI